jgi:hypothetical protein
MVLRVAIVHERVQVECRSGLVGLRFEEEIDVGEQRER